MSCSTFFARFYEFFMSQNRKTQLCIPMRRCVKEFVFFMSCAGKLYELETRLPPTAHDNMAWSRGKSHCALGLVGMGRVILPTLGPGVVGHVRYLQKQKRAQI